MEGENADHIIAGEGSVDAAHSKSFDNCVLTSIHVVWRPDVYFRGYFEISLVYTANS